MSKIAASTLHEDELREIARSAVLAQAEELAGALYANFYCRPREKATNITTRSEREAFVADLSFANSGTGHWDTGWNVATLDGDRIVVVKWDVRFWAEASDVRPIDGLSTGDRCRVHIAKELRALLPRFYSAVGNADGSDDSHTPLLRLYWNLTYDVASTYIRLITTKLNDAGIPFLTKVLSDPNGYVRADAAVLYVERKDAETIAPVVRQVYDELAPFLDDAVPMFTKRLAPGLAWAEDPGEGLSFGETRCRAIANGLIAAGDGADLDHRYRAICEALQNAGIDVREPYLCGGASNDYACLAMPEACRE